VSEKQNMSSIAAQCCDAGKGGYSLEALLVDIQRGSLHDGPGVRTTFFFKGCPLHCRWCHNPESQNPGKQLSFHREKCVGCGRCETACHSNVHWLTKTGTEQFRHQVYFEHCQFCGKCVEQCPVKALKIIGTPYTEEELLKIALLDRAFYEHSGGGITLSGGEVLQQADFAASFLSLCREEDLHTCVETSGFGTTDAMEKLLQETDLLYFDWKVSTEEDAKKWIGGSLVPILNNLALADKKGVRTVLRCPIIPGVNDNTVHFQTICDLLGRYPSIEQAQLLPYHSFGISKGGNIGQLQQEFPVPGEEEKKNWISWFEQNGKEEGKRVVLEH
jgi:glycyl-radical enzyme activating protein